VLNQTATCDGKAYSHVVKEKDFLVQIAKTSCANCTPRIQIKNNIKDKKYSLKKPKPQIHNLIFFHDGFSTCENKEYLKKKKKKTHAYMYAIILLTKTCTMLSQFCARPMKWGL
jgi:hypothetical protein